MINGKLNRVGRLFQGLPVIILFLLLTVPAIVMGGEADVLSVTVVKTGDQHYDFSVSVRHDDEGWNHYANRWEVIAPDGSVLGARILHHPHVHEQPFSRSLYDVAIPAGTARVTLRAYDSVHGDGGKSVEVELPQ